MPASPARLHTVVPIETVAECEALPPELSMPRTPPDTALGTSWFIGARWIFVLSAAAWLVVLATIILLA